MIHFRGDVLSGETPLVEVYRDVARELGYEKVTFLVGVQPDHPNRKSDLDTLIRYVKDNRDRRPVYGGSPWKAKRGASAS